MIWSEIHVDRPLSPLDVSELLARVFGVEASRVAVVEDMEDLPEPGTKAVVGERTDRDGDFPLTLTIYTFMEDVPPVAEAAQLMSGFVEARVLVSDESLDPYTWWLVSSGHVEQATVDPDALDEGKIVLT